MKKVTCIFLFVLASSIPIYGQRSGRNPEDNLVKSLSTVSGELRINDHDTSFSVELNGRSIYEQELPIFKFFLAPRHNFGDTDVVLLWIEGGGSHSGGSLKVITVKRDGSAFVAPQKFIGTGARPRVTRKGNSLILYFPAASPVGEGFSPAETWV